MNCILKGPGGSGNFRNIVRDSALIISELVAKAVLGSGYIFPGGSTIQNVPLQSEGKMICSGIDSCYVFSEGKIQSDHTRTTARATRHAAKELGVSFDELSALMEYPTQAESRGQVEQSQVAESENELQSPNQGGLHNKPPKHALTKFTSSHSFEVKVPLFLKTF